MADKFDDIRNQIVDCADCPNVQIYENETVIFFQVTGQQLQVIQKGTITIQYKDGAVLFFENGIFLFSACTVENVRKANNDTYASSYLELVVALSAFLGFSDSGGGGIANVANGIYDDGGTAKLGGNLVEDTTILGSNIYSFIVAFIDNFIAQGAVLQLLATSLVDISSDDAINIIANGILQLTSANQINIDSSGSIRLTSNTNEVGINGNSLFYFGAENADGSFRIGITAGEFTIEKRIAGIWTLQTLPVTANNGLNYTINAVKLGGALLANTTISGLFDLILSGLSAFKINTDIVEQQSTGKYIWGSNTVDGSYRIGVESGIFVAQRRIAGVWATINQDSEAIRTKSLGNVLKSETAFSVDVSSAVATTFLVLNLDINSQYAFNLTGSATRTGANGNASYQSVGGVRRSALGNTLSGTASTIQLESLAGNFAISSALVGNTLEFRVTSSVATKTRLEGILTIQKTTIPDNY
jgi:hypothetical protein